MASKAAGYHECELSDNDPCYVCVGHQDTKTGEIEDGLHRIDMNVQLGLVFKEPHDAFMATFLLSAHGSRPAHNHRLLNSETRVSINNWSEPNKITILLRKEAPCDTRVFLELWRHCHEEYEPCVLVATGSFSPKELMNKKKIEIKLEDATCVTQGTIYASLLSEKIDLEPSCSKDGSLTRLREERQAFLEDYQHKMYQAYEKLRPGDQSHWYVNVRGAHALIPLVTCVHMTSFVSCPETGTDALWKSLLDLALVETLGFELARQVNRPDSLFYQHQLTAEERGKVLNYMFSLPFTGFLYVMDHARRETKEARVGTDVWRSLRTRPLLLSSGSDASFDCEDAALHILESIHAFRNTKFKLPLLYEVQQKMIEEYDGSSLCIGMLKVKNGSYMAHAFAILGGKILIEGTTLTPGVWNHDDDDYERIYNRRSKLFDWLEKMDPSIKWSDFIQHTTPMREVKRIELYKNPIITCSQGSEGQVTIYPNRSSMNDLFQSSSSSSKKSTMLTFSNQPHIPPEWQPISWIDKASIAIGTSALDCACGGRAHSYCLLFYTSSSFYSRHQQLINKAMNAMHGCIGTSVQFFDGNREYNLVRLCVCCRRS